MRSHGENEMRALEVGFLADGVVAALAAVTKQLALRPIHLQHLEQGESLLRNLSRSVGPQALPSGSQLQLGALRTFSYAAEALRAQAPGKLSEGIKAYLEGIAGDLHSIAAGAVPEKQRVDEVRKFFEALGVATLDGWSMPRKQTLTLPHC